VSADSSVPTDVLIVGWYPGADAITSGRFVADQAAALRSTGLIRPAVLAFENAAVRGPGPLRDREAAAVAGNVAAAVRGASPFLAASAVGAPSVPVARLAVAAGATPASGGDHRAVHRSAAVRALLDAPGRPSWALVHGHVGYPEGVAAAEIAGRLGVPLVITEHASFLASLLAEPVVRERYRATLRSAMRVVTVSRMLAGEVVRIVPEIADRLVVIPNAVAVDDFPLARDADRVAGELLFVGSRPESKGIATLLRAFARVHASRPDTALRLNGRAGPGEGDAAWQRLAAELGVADAVRFEPPTDRPGVAAAMARADLFVHPSPRETFGVVAVEALASGLPVVAADSGGVSEVLGDRPEPYGALVPPGDPDALAGAILTTLGRRSSFEPERLRAHVVERFAADRVAGQLMALYQEILAETDGAVGSSPPVAVAAPVRSRRTIVVAFSRLELERAIADFPAGTFENATIVTASDAAGDELADVVDWGARPAGAVGRIRRRARRVIGRLDPRRERRADAVLDELSRTLAPSLAGGADDERPLLVCLSGVDHLVAAPFIADGRAIAAPGGLRWLADERASDQAGASEA
jgi:glycogen(starch) synthase